SIERSTITSSCAPVLVAGGMRVRSGCDTEVLLEHFIREGARNLSWIRGMYARCTGIERSTPFLARDPRGSSRSPVGAGRQASSPNGSRHCRSEALRFSLSAGWTTADGGVDASGLDGDC